MKTISKNRKTKQTNKNSICEKKQAMDHILLEDQLDSVYRRWLPELFSKKKKCKQIIPSV